MSVFEPPPIARFTVDSLEVLVFENRALAGHAAAQSVAREIRHRQQAAGQARLILAAAPSQNEFLAGLVADKEID
ncbi:MAG TPA: glucosamine-6-phosphate deaminase, partial [Isosphaeraceae bacterium]|nr:glucosamine-6-phosphate deaminase [Isosphaeraceae bacterium]